MKNIFAPAAVLLLIAQISLSAQPLVLDKTYTGIKELKLDLSTGDLEVSPASGNEISVKGYFDESKADVKVEQYGDRLVISEKKESRNNDHPRPKWVLQLPAEIKVDANFGIGNGKIDRFAGKLTGNSGTGSILLKQCTGDITWNTGTGNCEVNNCGGDIKLNTGTGDIELKNFKGDIAANSGTGDIEIDGAEGEIAANSGTGDVEAVHVTLTAGSRSSFNSGTGDVTVKLGGPAKGDISVNSGTGDADLDINNQSFDGILTMTCNKRDGRIQAPFGFDDEKTEGEGRNQVLIKTKRFGREDNELKVGTGTGTASVKK